MKNDEMEKIRFGIIGAGWRSEFYIRIAKAAPERFELSGVLIRDAQKAKTFAERFQVKTVQTLEDILADAPDFVVLSIKRGYAADYLIHLFDRGIPVLVETPPAENLEEMNRLWKAARETGAKVQGAEQYFLQPLYAAWHRAISDGLLGEVQNISLSAVHGYHAMSLIRWILGVKGTPCTIHGKRFSFPVTRTGGREGMIFSGEVFQSNRDRAVLEFEDGKTAFFDFSGKVQYHSFIRTRQLNIQGTRGEIDDLTIRYLTQENIPVQEELRRIDLGIYNNQEWSHYGIMLGKQFLYYNPMGDARLNDDETAIGSLLLGMGEYVNGGKEVYSLANGLQDMYLNLKLEEAYADPWTEVHAEPQVWDGEL